MRAKAAPCAMVSRWRSEEAASASASSATGRGVLGAPGGGEEERVGAPGAVREEVGGPGGEAVAAGDPARLDRPFEAVGIAVGADRVAGREPGGEGLHRREAGRVSHACAARRGRRRRRRGGGRGCGRGRRRRLRGGRAPSPGGGRRRAGPACPRSRGRAGRGCGPAPISAGVWRLPMCQARRASASGAAVTSTSGSARGLDGDEPAVGEDEGVAVVERDGLGQVDEEAGPAGGGRGACGAGSGRGSRGPPGRPAPRRRRRGGRRRRGASSALSAAAGSAPRRRRRRGSRAGP